MKEYNKDIEKAEKDIKKGRVYTQAQMEVMNEKWKKELFSNSYQNNI